MSLSDTDIGLPEDFRNDSDVHVYKLSDEEFKSRKCFLRDSCEIETEVQFFNRYIQWTDEMENQYLHVLQIREVFSNPLPEPVSLQNLPNKSLLAIFSKMHSRAFVRSFQLSKTMNRLLNENMTTFSVRIRNRKYISWRSKVWRYPNEGDWPLRFKNDDCIHDPTSILPFTFDLQDGVWDGRFAVKLLNRMKHPFLNLSTWYGKEPKLIWMPWMANAASLSVSGNVVDVAMIKQINPRIVWLEQKLNRLPRQLWDSVVFIAGISELDLDEIIRLWRSGDWDYKATKFKGWNQPYQEVTAVLKGYLFWIFKDKRLVFVPDPADTFLVLHMRVYRWQGAQCVDFYACLGIKKLADMINMVKTGPIDFSSYPCDPELPLNPSAYCNLLFKYGSLQRSWVQA